MHKSLISRLWLFAPVLLLTLSMISCSTTKKIKYFQDIPDSGQIKTIAKANYIQPVLQKGDLLNISIQTVDPSSTTMINSANLSSAGVSSPGVGSGGGSSILAALSGGAQSQASPASGVLVDQDGDIELPIIGKVKAAGSTTFQLQDSIYHVALKYFKMPTVIVRLANFRVNVTGEVTRPGQYTMPDEKESVLDAISMAGDLTIFGKRENVLLVRENPDGSKTAYRLNLKKSDVMSSPVYYLHQNDMIYVEPRKSKSDATDASQTKYITIAGSVLSILIILATRRF